jgi:hypothetical protein
MVVGVKSTTAKLKPPPSVGTVPKAPYYAKIYDLYVILGATNSPELWQWKNWQFVAANLKQFISDSRNRAAIRTTQFSKTSRKPVSFGRISLNENGDLKWTHGSPVTREVSDSWHFIGMEFWSPSWNVCEKEGLAPDVFFALRSENSEHRKTQIRFNQTVILAISVDASESVRSNAQQWVQELLHKLDSPLAAYQKRAWGKAFGSSGAFEKSIQHMAFIGLFKVGDYHNRPLDLQTFEESWAPVPSS